MLSAGLLALIGMGLFSPSVARAQTNRAPRARNTPQRKLSARQIAQRTGPSVVLLVTTDEGGNPIALGSGFFIQSNVIATANHVIKDAPQIYAKIAGRRARHKISFVGSSDEKNDLALLRIDDVKGQPLKLGNLSRLRVGDEIYVMGNPEGLEGTFSLGNISAIRNREGLIQITAPISHGSSGGPVLDERGEVIGVATAMFTEGQNLNFAVPVSKLAALLKDDNDFIQYVEPGNSASSAPKEPVPDWEFVASNGGTEYYISRNRITRTPEHTHIAWIKEVPNDSPAGQASRKGLIDLLNTQNVNRSYAFRYSMDQREFDCGRQRWQGLRTVEYDQDGRLLYDWGESSTSTSWYSALPDSVDEALLKYVCKGRE
jgi:S1-C subfamily serine protease